MENEDKKLMTLGDLALHTQVSTRTLRRYIKLGLPVIRIGDLMRFDYEDVLDWFKKQEEV